MRGRPTASHQFTHFKQSTRECPFQLLSPLTGTHKIKKYRYTWSFKPEGGIFLQLFVPNQQVRERWWEGGTRSHPVLNEITPDSEYSLMTFCAHAFVLAHHLHWYSSYPNGTWVNTRGRQSSRVDEKTVIKKNWKANFKNLSLHQFVK